jgi:AcrR family transcriptional regulator
MQDTSVDASAAETALSSVPPSPELPPRSPAGASRRRGAALLGAIHNAVLAELSEGSMATLTMERIAERAQTGKAALYRRWASREELIIDTINFVLVPIPLAPDGRNIRDQFVYLLGDMAATLAGPEGALARHVLSTLHTNERMRTALMERLVQPRQTIMLEALAAAAERGEVRPEAVTAIVAQVGPSLLLYRFFVFGAISFSDAVEVVDQVLLPLVRPPGASVLQR